MRDFGKIIIGIIVFLALLSIPIIVSQVSGHADYIPDSELQFPDQETVSEFLKDNVTAPADDAAAVAALENRIDNANNGNLEDGCIESTDYMAVHHMTLIFDWRTWVVRDDADSSQDDHVVPSNGDGDFYYIASDGTIWLMNLDATCLGCHTDRDTFCNVCHNYMAVRPNCWDCHDYTGES